MGEKNEKKKEEKKEKKEEKKEKKKSRSSSSSSSSDDDFGGSFRGIRTHKGYSAFYDMCDEPTATVTIDACDDIYDGLCVNPKTRSDEDFCDYAGFGKNSRKKSSKAAKYEYQ